MPRPKRWELVGFIGGKALVLTLAFGLPLLVHPLWMVLLFYVLITGLAGVIVSVVFQLAHCVEEAEFPLPQENSGANGKCVGGPSSRNYCGFRSTQ